MMENLDAVKDSNDLWLTIKLQSQLYAIDSTFVESIALLEESISVLPESNTIKPGIIHSRGRVIPIVNLRAALGLKTLEQEQSAFEEMLDQRKNDHIHWVKEMERCLLEDDTFHLTTDPHKCAFGKWYDTYETENQTIAFHIRKIDEPHKKLHHTAHLAFECPRECDDCEREQCLRDQLKEDAHTYMRIVVDLLDQAKTIFRQNSRTMCVITKDKDNALLGLLVDEVMSVENLTLKGLPESCMRSSGAQVLSHIGEKEESKATILVLNMDGIFSL
ncbi:chemotaxis protein CheW [Anaerotignum sp. MB30-C6]|uniref:chemotaxis protein CheW n=1 Tax=Anaerotignum sp. MB30-C6 TaxID=3070814 RepID=UPI0027DD01F1|nr:chemotaxis protein CheW [Anaerotignum sp. MB30-C6]WMI80365.1 chemotaxis protein CheW [Anaerotignum sp. MB30-C6]